MNEGMLIEIEKRVTVEYDNSSINVPGDSFAFSFNQEWLHIYKEDKRVASMRLENVDKVYLS